MPRAWKTLVLDYVRQECDAGGYFSMRDLEKHFDAMHKEKPNNSFIAEKVRQQLQILRDEGKISFLIPGSYRLVNHD